jgi:uncharacterized membrane protein YczE
LWAQSNINLMGRTSPPGGLTAALSRLLLAHPLCGAGVALSIRSGLGATPWDVFHLGLQRVTGLSIGTTTTAVSLAALVVAIASGVHPGAGTVINVLLLGPCIDAALAQLPRAPRWWWALGYQGAAVVLIGVGTGLYVSAGLGNAPRDSLMLALARRRRWSTRRARTVIELLALVAGGLLGGPIGLGTLLYGLAIGPVVQWSIAWLEPAARAAAQPCPPESS